MARRMVFDRRAIEIADRLKAERGNHRDDQRFDEEQFAVERGRAGFPCMDRQRGDCRHGGQQKAYHTDFGTDRRPRHHARAKAEDKADGDEVQQRIVRGYCNNIEQGDEHGGCIVADRIAALPSPQFGKIANGARAEIGAKRGKARQRRERAKCGQAEKEGAAEFIADQEANPDEDSAQADDGEPHAEKHGNEVAVHRERQSRGT